MSLRMYLNVCLYRNDDLACLDKINGPASDIIKSFWMNFGFKLTIATNLKTVNFLDVTFNLCTREYQPYNKPNDTPTYITVNSNQLPNIIKAFPDNISKRISNVSSDKAAFNSGAFFDNEVLSESGYKENLTNQEDLTLSKKVRQGKIKWFNPPCMVV